MINTGQEKPIYIRQENFAKKFSFLNFAIAAALLLLITLVGFRFLRSPQIGRIQWELKDEASGDVIDRGTCDVFPQDVKVKGKDNTNHSTYIKSVMLNKDFAFENLVQPTSERIQPAGIMVIVSRHDPNAIGGAWFNTLNDHEAAAIQSNSRLTYDTAQVDAKWQISKIVFASDVKCPVRVYGSPSASPPKWTITIFKDSYMDWSK